MKDWIEKCHILSYIIDNQTVLCEWAMFLAMNEQVKHFSFCPSECKTVRVLLSSDFM